MQFRLILNTKQWQARWPQCGSQSGWSEWGETHRDQALHYIENGFGFETLERLP